MKVQIRVTSPWNARAIRSNISRMCSPMSSGMPLGRATPVAGRLLGARLGLRDPQLELADGGQVLVDLAAVVHAQPVAELLGVVEDEVEDALLIDAPACARSAGEPSRDREAKSRSKTSLGLISLAIGMFADRQEMFDE